MNNTFDNSLEQNFRDKCNLEFNILDSLIADVSEYNYDNLIKLLCTDDINKKQYAILELNEIRSVSDAESLVANLVGQDSRIREAVAFKINDLSIKQEYGVFFNGKKIFATFLQGIMDINGNVCRQIVNLIKVNDGFYSYLCEKLPDIIIEVLKKIDKLNSEDKQYVLSKRNFQLYWCLEALYSIIDGIDVGKIRLTLLKTGEFYDYTIREKTAKVLTRLNEPEFIELKEKLKNDENYYVRRYLVNNKCP